MLPDDGIATLLTRISSAKRRVYMKMYLLTDPQVIEALAQAQANGAEVRAMLEQTPFGGAASARSAFAKLQAKGIQVKYANAVFRFTHEKSYVIDDQAVVLTANMTRTSFSRNREFGVVIEDKTAISQIVAAFEADWGRTAFTPTAPQLAWSPTTARDRLTELVAAARSTIRVYCASAQDEGMLAALTAAQKRGVTVQLITSAGQSEEGDGDSQGLDELQRGGVGVRISKTPYIHAKVFLVDDQLAFVGSQNLTTGSLEFNRELGVIFSDPDAVARLSATFKADWERTQAR